MVAIVEQIRRLAEENRIGSCNQLYQPLKPSKLRPLTVVVFSEPIGSNGERIDQPRLVSRWKVVGARLKTSPIFRSGRVRLTTIKAQ